MEKQLMKFESRPDDHGGSNFESLKKDKESWKVRWSDRLFDLQNPYKTGVENLIKTLKRADYFDFKFEIETLEKFRLYVPVKDIVELKKSIEENDPASLRRTVDHHIYDLSYLRSVGEKFRGLYYALMDFQQKFYSISKYYSRVLAALDAKGMKKEADEMFEKYGGNEMDDQTSTMTQDELLANKDELLTLADKIIEEKNKIFGEDEDKDLQNQLNIARKSIESIFSISS